MKMTLTSTVGLAAAVLLSSPAHAGLNGTVVGLKAYYPDISSVYSSAGTAVVGPGAEFGPGSLPGYLQLSFDVSDSQIAICCGATFADAPFNGFAFTFSSVIPTGASVDPASAYAPFSLSLIGDTLFLNYQNVSSVAPGPSLIDLTFGASGAPEPAVWALMIMGFGLIGQTARRRRAAAV